MLTGSMNMRRVKYKKNYQKQWIILIYRLTRYKIYLKENAICIRLLDMWGEMEVSYVWIPSKKTFWILKKKKKKEKCLTTGRIIAASVHRTIRIDINEDKKKSLSRVEFWHAGPVSLWYNKRHYITSRMLKLYFY